MLKRILKPTFVQRWLDPLTRRTDSKAKENTTPNYFHISTSITRMTLEIIPDHCTFGVQGNVDQQFYLQNHRYLHEGAS